MNVVDAENCSALHAASIEDHPDVVQVLIDNGANVNAQDVYGMPPLQITAKHGYVEVAKKLLQAGADLEIKNNYKQTALYCAATGRHVGIVKLFLKYGANIKAREKSGGTVLHTFLSHQGEEDSNLLKILLRHGANPNAMSHHGHYPLIIACSKRYISSTLLLICFGAKIRRDAIDCDETGLLFMISKIIEERRSNRCEDSNLMSEEEEHFMKKLAFSCALKYKDAAFNVFSTIRSFVTYKGIFMAHGYDIGQISAWFDDGG